MLRRMMALLTVLCLLSTGMALAEENALQAEARRQAEDALTELRSDATGWTATMLENAQIVSVEQENKTIVVRISVPEMACGVSAKAEAGEDVTAYLAEAFAPALTLSPVTELQMTFTETTKNGETTLKWGSGTPKAFLNKVKNLAKTAKSGYSRQTMRAALERYLLPHAAQMPKKQPEEAPELPALDGYGAQVADRLSLTAEQAASRLPALLMLMELTKVDPDDGLQQTVLTVRVKDWQAMLDAATLAAQAELDVAVGVPDMTRVEIDEILCRCLPDVCAEAYYGKKRTTETLTVDLTAAVGTGVQEAEALMAYFDGYNQAFERCVDTLMAYGATLSDYPKIPLIDSGVLSGEESGDALLTFDPGQSENHVWVALKKNGLAVLTGFARQGGRLTVRVPAGDYEVYYTMGPEWFGERYQFGDQADFGVSDIHAMADSRTVIHMDKTGEQAATALTEDEFRQAIEP